MPVDAGPSLDNLHQSIRAAVCEADAELRELAMSIYSKPELAWEEHDAHDVLTAYMERQPGFTVVRHAYSLPTAWSATYGSSDDVTIGFNSEFDALKGIGHACGHHLIAIAGVAAAIGVARALHDHNLPGRVVLLGTPAEEHGGGKCDLLERGAYDGMDACLMVHPGPKGKGAGTMTSTCIAGVEVQFSGRSAHAGGAPERGINALDAAVLGYSNISALRQQVADGCRIHGIITGGEDWSVNAIPASSKLAYGIRAPSAAALAALIPRVLACFSAAALATGCTYTVFRDQMYLDLRQNGGLASTFKDYAMSQWGEEGYEVSDLIPTSASTDFGNVSYRFPAFHPMFNLPDADPDDFPHSPTFARASATASAHKAALRAAEGIAATGLRVLVDSDFRSQIRQEWESEMHRVEAHKVEDQLDQALPKSKEPVKGRIGTCACGSGEK